MAEEVCVPVAHRQVVLAIPKRLRLRTRFDRKLLGKSAPAPGRASRTKSNASSVARTDPVAGMVAAIQPHGELLRWHPHVHTLVTCGAFTPQSDFVELPLAFAGPDRRRKLPLGKWDLLAAAPS